MGLKLSMRRRVTVLALSLRFPDRLNLSPNSQEKVIRLSAIVVAYLGGDNR